MHGICPILLSCVQWSRHCFDRSSTLCLRVVGIDEDLFYKGVGEGSNVTKDLLRGDRSNRLPQLDGVPFRIVNAGKAAVGIRHRVHLHHDARCFKLAGHLV